MYAQASVLCWLLIAGLHPYTECSQDEISSRSIGGGITNNRPWAPESNQISPDDIRCFCNLPQCVATSYMCRTARSPGNGGCFSEVRDPANKSTTRHGCVEFLKDLSFPPMQCDNSPRKHHTKTPPAATITSSSGGISSATSVASSTGMLLLCCQEDMCNHVDSPENQKMKLDLKDNTEISDIGHFKIINNDDIDILNVPMQQTTPGSSNNDGWFFVATILVAIIGVIIFFALISVAIKILRSDKISSPSLKLDSSNELVRKLPIDCEAQTTSTTTIIKQSPHPCRYTINNHYDFDICDKKNETRAKINQLMNLEYCLVPQCSSGDNIKPNNIQPSGSNNLYRNVNISLDSTHRNKDNMCKVYEKEVLSPVTATLSNNSNNYKSYDI